MAEGENTGSNSWESWLGGWVQTAKEKSSTAFEMVKKDLAEFTCTMQKDTEKAVEVTRDSLNKENTTHATNRVKAGLTSFLDNISKALVIPPDDDYIPMKVAPDGSGLYDRGKARLHAIQLDASTYMDPPRGSPEQFNMWLESFNLDQHKGEISELLVSKVEVRALYTKLVPSEVSHAEFWQRYFYRVHQLQLDEARKQALMKRADQTKGDSFTWDDDDDWSGGEEDDGDHSDWEKMPRPPQSYAATAQIPTQQTEKQPSSVPLQSVTSNSEAILSPEVKETTQKTVGMVYKDSAMDSKQVNDEDSKKYGAESTVGKQEVEKDLGGDLETSLSAFAAGTDVTQPAVEKSVSNIVNNSAEPEASQATLDASGDSLSSPQVLQKPSADLWSLHIPDDTASASQSGLDDAEVGETGVPEPASPSNVYRQAMEGGEVLDGFSSCAAAGGDLAAAVVNQSGITTADGACGAADMGSTPSIPHQAEPVADPSPDISAASVEVAVEAQATPLSDQDASPLGTSPSVGSAEEPDLSAEAMPPSVGSTSFSTEKQPASVSAPTVPVTTISETLPVSSEAVPISDNAPELATTSTPAMSNLTISTPQASSAHVENTDSVQKDEKPHSEEIKPTCDNPNPIEHVEGAEGGEMKEIGMRVKGDMVVVGDRGSPSSSSDSNEMKEVGLEDEWEQDFDIEITEDDLKAAEDIAKRLGENLNVDDDDWENWE